MQNRAILEGFAPMDYDEVVDFDNMTVETIFEVFNGVVSAVESEANYRASFSVETYGTVPYSEKRNLELVKTYDEFINTVIFELDAFSVGKMEMENFWASVGRRNSINIGNKAVTYGKSTIYVVRRGVVVIGFLLNNMTYDGQNMYFLSSKHLKDSARSLFKGTSKYPSSNKYIKRNNKSNGQIEECPTRWTRIIEYLSSVGGTTINAWSLLESEDSRYFYAELKKHNVFNPSDKALLKSIRKMGRVTSLDCRIEAMESRLAQLKDLVDEYEENEDTETSVFEYFDAKDEIIELERDLLSFTEEHNNESPVTTLEDYKW